jgi:hypothetical protein
MSKPSDAWRAILAAEDAGIALAIFGEHFSLKANTAEVFRD